MPLLLLFALLSVVFSFLCSVWEAALLSIPPSFVELKSQEGGKVGKLLKKFKDDIDIPLSAILTLNTIAHTVGAIGVGAQGAKVYGDSLTATVVIPVLMTLVILILSEIIPKTIGASYWKQLAGFTVKSLNIIVTLLYPLVFVSKWITKWFKNEEGSVLSRQDFSAMTNLGMKEEVLGKEEGSIIHNLLRFRAVVAENIMTPRTVIITADQDMTIADFYHQNPQLRFSRIPLYKGKPDHVTGFILKDVLLSSMLEDKGQQSLESIARPILIVKEDTPLPQLFNTIVERREHIAMVSDEFGGMSGVVTMEDVIETLLGLEIVDELDNTDDMQALARKNWEKRAKVLGLIKKDQKE